MADHTEMLGAPMVDVGPAIDRALDSWAQNVQPRVKQVVRKLSAPKEIVEDTQAWVKAKAPAARHAPQRLRSGRAALRSRVTFAPRRRRSINVLQDNVRDVARSKNLGEATGKLRALQRRFQDVRPRSRVSALCASSRALTPRFPHSN